ncbi:hypothetical protein [Pseudoduganella sp. R-43]|uniref:hypothetical protein n=1 Tax=unclassified Pseudoduganella TaxID=2637179 RepID=UPI003CF1F6ED
MNAPDDKPEIELFRLDALYEPSWTTLLLELAIMLSLLIKVNATTASGDYIVTKIVCN